MMIRMRAGKLDVRLGLVMNYWYPRFGYTDSDGVESCEVKKVTTC